MNKKLKLILKITLEVIIVLFVIVGSYFAYVFISYHRIEDNFKLEATGNANNTEFSKDEIYTAMTYNLGYGAYSQDYTFFMDGGKEVSARSLEEAQGNIKSAVEIIKNESPDLIALQEIDLDAKRTYYDDQSILIENEFPNYQVVEAINYDSSFLFYPILDPIGNSISEIMTLSNRNINNPVRRSLPISDKGLDKFFDLDRCYTFSEIQVNDGKKIYFYNLHLSAYGAESDVKYNQVKMLLSDMQKHYDDGHYVIACGDFNTDILGNSVEKYNGTTTELGWAQPFPTELLSDNFELLTTYDEGCEFPTTRANDIPFDPNNPEASFRVLIDGFIVSDNIDVISQKVINTEYNYSDHLPVVLKFGFK